MDSGAMHVELICCSQFPKDNSEDELFRKSTPLNGWLTFKKDFSCAC